MDGRGLAGQVRSAVLLLAAAPCLPRAEGASRALPLQQPWPRTRDAERGCTGKVPSPGGMAVCTSHLGGREKVQPKPVVKLGAERRPALGMESLRFHLHSSRRTNATGDSTARRWDRATRRASSWLSCLQQGQSTGYFRKKTRGHSQGTASPRCGLLGIRGMGHLALRPRPTSQSCLQGLGRPGACQAQQHPRASPYTCHVPGSTRNVPTSPANLHKPAVNSGA